jgi:hypothetical protein
MMSKHQEKKAVIIEFEGEEEVQEDPKIPSYWSE